MKKPKNSKGGNTKLNKRPHVLDVTLTQQKERAKRARTAFRRVFGAILFIGLIVGSYVGGKEALRRFLWENPDYFVREVIFRTDGTLLREDVIQHAQIIEGQNIFRLDLANARRLISELPQVERVDVERHLPNRINVVIVERKPIAWVMNRADEEPTVSKKAYLIDARAIPMKPRSKLHQFMHLPIITGFPIENLADGQRVTNYEILAALDLVRLNQDNQRWQIRTIDVQSGYSLLVTDIRRIQFLFHLDNLERQVTRLHKLFEIIGGERQKELMRVNLFGERNTYVEYRPPPELEPETPEPVAHGPAPSRTPTKPVPPVKSTQTTKSMQAAKSTPPPKATPAPKKVSKPTRPAPTPAPAPSPQIRKASAVDPLKKPFNY